MLPKRLAVTCLAFAASVAAGAARAANPAVVDLPFTLVRGAIVVQARIDGRGPFPMMLDSGADPSIVDIGTARAAGLKVSRHGGQGSGTGTDVNLAYPTRLDAVDLGGLHAKDVEALAMDLSRIGAALGTPLQGVLGRSLMRGRIVQIDYPRKVVHFFAVSPLHGRATEPDTPRRTTLAYRYHEDLLLSGVKVNGRPALANLDTGSNGAFMVAPRAVVPLGLAGDLARAQVSRSTGFNGQAENRAGSVDRVEVGSLVADHPPVVFASPGTGRDDVAWAVRIGSAFLQDYVVTIDDVSHRVRIERP